MEDISRELEREIARAKPSPYKTSRKKKILVVDDFGEFKSGGYLKVLVYLFLIISVIGISGTLGFYFLFTNTSRENLLLKEEVAGLKTKTGRLTNDKEILMARLVMAGKKPELEIGKAASDEITLAQAKEKKPGVKPKPDFKNGTQKKVDEKKAVVPEQPVPVASVPESKKEAGVSSADKPAVVSPAAKNPEIKPALAPFVAVEKFSVLQGNTSTELVVRFDIRNISAKPGGISGRIFTVLKPKEADEKGWVVVPGAPLKKGMPTPYRKGQYFSISRFKPVKFTVRSQASPDSFHTATVYIFNDDGTLMFEGNMRVNEVEAD